MHPALSCRASRTPSKRRLRTQLRHAPCTCFRLPALTVVTFTDADDAVAAIVRFVDQLNSGCSGLGGRLEAADIEAQVDGWEGQVGPWLFTWPR